LNEIRRSVSRSDHPTDEKMYSRFKDDLEIEIEMLNDKIRATDERNRDTISKLRAEIESILTKHINQSDLPSIRVRKKNIDIKYRNVDIDFEKKNRHRH